MNRRLDVPAPAPADRPETRAIDPPDPTAALAGASHVATTEDDARRLVRDDQATLGRERKRIEPTTAVFDQKTTAVFEPR